MRDKESMGREIRARGNEDIKGRRKWEEKRILK